MKKLLMIVLVLALALSVVACGNDKDSTKDKVEAEIEEKTEVDIQPIKERPIVEVEENRPVVSIVFKDYETISLELYPEIAPNTVNNFLSLAQDGFYDGLKFHRVITNFMIQGGDPDGNGTGGPGYSINAEFTKENGDFITYLSHSRGVISMARSSDINSAGSQFFIVHKDQPGLDLQYTAFGKVIAGIEVVDLIAGVATGEFDNPLEEVLIERIEVQLNGYEPQEVIKN